MHFTISTSDFSKGLSRTQGVVEKKSTMPILAHVLLEVGKKELKLTATDLEISITCSLQAKVEEKGRIAISARSLFDVVRGLPGDEVTVRLQENNRLEVKSGNAQYMLVGMSAEDFPTLPSLKDVSSTKLDGSLFSQMIQRTIFAVSTDETRYNLNGVFLENGSDKSILMVSTDGHRLAKAVATLEGAAFPLKEGVILPRKGLNELKRILDEAKEPGKLGFSGNHAIYEAENVTLMMRLLEGQFPDYQQVIPQDNHNKATISRTELLETTRRVSVLAPEKSQAIKLSFSKDLISVTCQNPEIGEAKEDLAIKYDGQEISLGVNARYIQEALGVIDRKEVLLEMADELSPLIMRGVDDLAFLCVVMPMRV